MKQPILNTPTYKLRDLMARMARLNVQCSRAIEKHFPIGCEVIVVGFVGEKLRPFRGTIAHYSWPINDSVVVRINDMDAEASLGMWKTLVNKYPDAYTIMWERVYLPSDYQRREALKTAT